MRISGNNNPTVSVIMGVLYKKDNVDLLRRSVDSILNQSYADFEFVICPSGSSMEAVEYLCNTAEADNRVRLISLEDKYDLASKLNACLNASRGSYIARMDDDDFSHPDRLEKQTTFLGTNPSIAFVGCDVNQIREKKVVSTRSLPETPCVKDFFFSMPFIHPTLVFRRKVLDEVGGYSEKDYCRLCEDYDLLLRLYKLGYIGMNVKEKLYDYSLPPLGIRNRSLRDRWHESVTRYRRFKDLGVLRRALPYVVKPILVGLLPIKMLEWLKFRKSKND